MRSTGEKILGITKLDGSCVRIILYTLRSACLSRYSHHTNSFRVQLTCHVAGKRSMEANVYMAFNRKRPIQAHADITLQIEVHLYTCMAHHVRTTEVKSVHDHITVLVL